MQPIGEGDVSLDRPPLNQRNLLRSVKLLRIGANVNERESVKQPRNSREVCAREPVETRTTRIL
eukprot:5070777-Prymnesium_polylepis.1